MKLTLHIGLPKTATTTIQHSLHKSKKLLHAHRICYPGHFVEHHDLINSVRLIASGRRAFHKNVAGTLAGFHKDAIAANADHILISSEAMATVSDDEAEILRTELIQSFPSISDFSILCYVREPIAFASSLGQQEIKAGKLRLAEFYENPWFIDIAATIQRFQRVFGQHCVTVRYLHPDHLKHGNALVDFLDVLGIKKFPKNKKSVSLNSSLSQEGLLIADALNEFRPKGSRLRKNKKAYKHILEGIPGQKFILPEYVQEKVVQNSIQDMIFLQENFGIPITPVRQPQSDGYLMPDTTARAVAKLIERLVESYE